MEARLLLRGRAQTVMLLSCAIPIGITSACMEIVLILGAVFVVVFLVVGGGAIQGVSQVEGSLAEKDTARALGKKPQDSTGAALGCGFVAAALVSGYFLGVALGWW